MTRSTEVKFDVVSDDGHTTHFTTPWVKGMVEKIRIRFTFDNGRDGRVTEVVEIPIKFLDPNDVLIQFTDPPPSAQEMRAHGERLIQLAEELGGD